MNLGMSARGAPATAPVLGVCGGASRRDAAVPLATAAEVKGEPHRTAVGDRVKPVLPPFWITAPGAKMTLVHYVATWCESSKRWMSKVEEMSKEDRAALVAREAGATFPIVCDAKHQVTVAIPARS